MFTHDIDKINLFQAVYNWLQTRDLS